MPNYQKLIVAYIRHLINSVDEHHVEECKYYQDENMKENRIITLFIIKNNEYIKIIDDKTFEIVSTDRTDCDKNVFIKIFDLIWGPNASYEERKEFVKKIGTPFIQVFNEELDKRKFVVYAYYDYENGETRINVSKYIKDTPCGYHWKGVSKNCYGYNVYTRELEHHN